MNGGLFFLNDPEFREHLREPFAPELIGKLPRAATKDGKPGRCKECGGWHVLPAIHLDFVGHAAVTDRLNQVAPDWTYKVTHIEKDGQGHVKGILGDMTIGGKTLPEAGTPDRAGDFGEEMKQALSDFIRRGAMRFGVALDLWSKQDLSDRAAAPGQDGPTASAPPSGSTSGEVGKATRVQRSDNVHPQEVTSGDAQPIGADASPGREAVSPEPTSSDDARGKGKDAAAPDEETGTAEDGAPGPGRTQGFDHSRMEAEAQGASSAVPITFDHEKQVERAISLFGGDLKGRRNLLSRAAVVFERSISSIDDLSSAELEDLILSKMKASA